VVVGYGTTRKRDLTGSVASVKADEINASPITTFDQALQGRAAGVQVTQTSGKPGSETSIRIRGTSSITAGSEPLYVIDGMLINSDGGDLGTGVTRGPRISPLAALNPSEIESIDILEDASAAAIYGSRGANGVVIITTKRGKAGQSIVNFNSYYGVQEISNKVEVLNAAQFANLVNEAQINANQTPVYVNPKNLGVGTDWQNEILRTAPIANYQLSFSGGDEKTKYALSGGYFAQDGIVLNSDFKRYSFRVNLDKEVNKKLTVGNSVSFSHITSTGVLTNAGTIVPGVTTAAQLFNPVLPVYDASVPGGYTFENAYRGKPGFTLGNPVAEALEFTSFSTNSRILGNLYATYKIIEGLEFKTTFGIDGTTVRDNSFGPNFLKRTVASEGEASIGEAQALTWLNENTLTYNKNINSNNTINAVLGYTMQEFKNQGVINSSLGFPDGRTGYHDISVGENPLEPINFESKWNLISYLGRVNYTLNNKYLFTVTGRADGSSKFAKGNRYGFFPSAAFAWRISDETFMKDVDFISGIKLRTSYGLLGNQAIAPYQTLALIRPFGEGVFNVDNAYTGREPVRYVNKDLTWESTRQFDIGLDASILKGRVNFTVDYYNKKTSDLLLSTPIPTTSGFTSTVLNVGNLQNSGVGLNISTVNSKGKLQWNTDVNVSVNRNKVTSLNNDQDILFSGSLLRVGEPIGTFYGYVFDGIFQTDAEAVAIGQQAKAGDRKYKDLNNDKQLNDLDRTIIGSAQPDFTFGLSNDIKFKNFDITFFFQGSVGNEIANLNSFSLLNFNGQNNVLAEAALNRWTPTNPSNEYPRAVASATDLNLFSSAIVEDASYVRLKSLTIGYTIPQNLSRKIKVQNARIYLSGSNIWTLTNYTGFNPEGNTYGQNNTLVGFDYGAYPMAKTYTLGLNIGF
ncbi:MAG: SusC/RagA family TonB-linked outer membrane protein, partial [Sphingobacteriaceae bacterium]